MVKPGMASSEKMKKTGGTGVSPVQSFKITRRTLPHWQDPGRVYFLTWRCKKGEVLSSEERTIALEALQYWDGRKWTLYAAVVMPDHVHALAQPLSSPQGGASLIWQRLSIVSRASAAIKLTGEETAGGLSGKMSVMTGLSGMRRNFWRNGSIL
jgi:REP element-mobilizing transposase RayT